MHALKHTSLFFHTLTRVHSYGVTTTILKNKTMMFPLCKTHAHINVGTHTLTDIHTHTHTYYKQPTLPLSVQYRHTLGSISWWGWNCLWFWRNMKVYTIVIL